MFSTNLTLEEMREKYHSCNDNAVREAMRMGILMKAKELGIPAYEALYGND